MIKKKIKNVTQSGHGTSTGVNLSQFNLNTKDYLVTAAHVVYEENLIGKMEILVKIPNIGWINATVVKIDKSLDIAILKTAIELPYISEIDEDKDIYIGTNIINVGCPENIDPVAKQGNVIEMYKESYVVKVEGFYHGSSGGGMFRKSSGKLLGVSTNGVADKDESIRNETWHRYIHSY